VLSRKCPKFPPLASYLCHMDNFDERHSPLKIITKNVALAMWAMEEKEEMSD